MSTPAVEVIVPERPERNKRLMNTGPSRNLITLQDVKRIVHRALSYEAEILNFFLLPYSDGKLGYLGTHQRLCVEAKGKTQKEILCFFVKAIPYDVPTQAKYIMDRAVFEQEITFYRDIIPKLSEEFESEPWSPGCYLVHKDVLVLEDLGAKGYFAENKLFGVERVKAGLACIARMHAASLCAEARLGAPLNELYPHCFKEKGFCRTGDVWKWFHAGVKAAVAVADHLGIDSSLIPRACEQVFIGVQPSPTKKNVASHGDLWGNNLMFNKDPEPKCLLVDFQLLRYAPLAHDVAQFLHLCTSRKFREAWEESMLKHYYKVLQETINSKKTRAEIPPWSELIRGLEEQRLTAVITAVMYFPTVLMDGEVSARVMSDPVSYAEHVFESRDEIVLANMKRGSEYGERIAEAVTELVELSSRLDELPKPS